MIANLLLILVGLMHWDAGSFDKMGESIYLIHKQPLPTIQFLAISIIAIISLHLTIKSLIYKKLLGLLD